MKRQNNETLGTCLKMWHQHMEHPSPAVFRKLDVHLKCMTSPYQSRFQNLSPGFVYFTLDSTRKMLNQLNYCHQLVSSCIVILQIPWKWTSPRPHLITKVAIFKREMKQYIWRFVFSYSPMLPLLLVNINVYVPITISKSFFKIRSHLKQNPTSISNYSYLLNV